MMRWKFQNKLRSDATRVLRTDFSQYFRVSNRDFEQGIRRAGWASATLFPILQSAGKHTKQGVKYLLRCGSHIQEYTAMPQYV